MPELDWSLFTELKIMYQTGKGNHFVPFLVPLDKLSDPAIRNDRDVSSTTRMWANAQRDGRPAEYRWRPLFSAAKFG